MSVRRTRSAKEVGVPAKSVRRAPTDRFAFLLLLLVGLLVMVGGRLLWLQGVTAPAYAKIAAEQRLKDLTIAPKRGVIFDREGEPLAISVDAKTIYAVPGVVKDTSATAQALAGVLGGSPADFVKPLTRKSSFSYVARKVELERAKRLQDLKIEGIGFLDDSRRTYPSGRLACQILGFVGVDDKGLAGIEHRYDRVLGGTPGRVLAERDPYGRIIPGGVMSTADAVDGRDIVLTIDKDIQYQAQLELASVVQTSGAKGGSIVIMDPRSGEIYAMASWPEFDPNYFKFADPSALSNTAITQPYEPGSTIKPFTASGVIDKKILAPASRFVLPSTIRIGDRTIGEAHDRETVDYSLTEIIAKSSNVGAVKLGQALGKRGVFDYFDKFGFMERTGVDYPGETRGFTPEPSTWSASSIGNIPFGQGMTATPLQLSRGYAAFAAGGEMPTPHFLLQVPAEKTSTIWPKQRAVSEGTARQMAEILRQVVVSGTGGAAEVPGYEAAGKTGTAQKVKNGTYKDGGFVASFVGFLPARDPRLLIAVVIDEPVNGYYGGAIAAPVFGRLGQFCVNHLKIPPPVVTAAKPATPGTPRAGASSASGDDSGSAHD
jgi:cell division protein FtsI/penicillin-binding protein 2